MDEATETSKRAIVGFIEGLQKAGDLVPRGGYPR